MRRRMVLRFAIVSKDSDFREGSFAEGHPPKVIWLAVGNAGTAEITDYYGANEIASNHSRNKSMVPC